MVAKLEKRPSDALTRRGREFVLRLITWLLVNWADLCRRGGALVALVFLGAAAFAGNYTAHTLKVNTDTSEMLDPDLPFQKNAATLRSAFPQIKTDIAILVRARSLDEADAFAEALTDRLAQNPAAVSAVYAPAQDPFFARNGLLYLSTQKLSENLDQLMQASSLLESLAASPYADTLFETLADKDALAAEADLGADVLARLYGEISEVVDASLAGETRPFSWMGALAVDEAGPEGHLRLVYATPALDYSRLQPAKLAIEAIRADIAAVSANFAGRVETFITGDPALRADELQSVTQGIGVSFGLSFALVAVLLWWAMRSLWLTGVTLTALIMTLIFTAAFSAAAIGELNLISVAFTVLLTGLGLDFAIHMLMHFCERRDEGQSPRLALRGGVRDVASGLVLAAITTALAFFSFIPTAFIGIAQLGLIAGVGVLIALVVSITFVPAAIGLRSGSSRPIRSRPDSNGNSMLKRLTNPVAAATIVAGIGAAFLAPRAYFDADPMALRNAQSESVRGFNLLFSDTDTIPYRLTRLVSSESEAIETASAARALSVVGAVRSLPDFVPKDQEEKLELIDFASASLAFAFEQEVGPQPTPIGGGAQALERRLSDAHKSGDGARLADALRNFRENAKDAQIALLQSNLFAYWPALADRLKSQFNAELVTLDALPEGLKTRYLADEKHWRVDILPREDVRDRAALKRFVDAVEREFPDVSGGALQSTRAGEVISTAMAQATAIALLVITVILFLLIGRPILIALMIMPLVLAASLTIAAGVVLDVPFNYANVIVLPLLLGIGVDAGIHLVMRQQRMKAGEEVHGSATSRAIWYAALTTVASFGSLMLSPHPGTASMGALLSIAIGFTLLCTLFTLPAAFQFWEKRLAPRPNRP